MSAAVRFLPDEIQTPDLLDSGPVYAISFDLDTDNLKAAYKNASFNNAYAEIRTILKEWDFNHQQGSVYFGDRKKVDAVRCVLAVDDLIERLPYLEDCITDIRMLRIEDNNDLMPVVNRAVERKKKKSKK